MTLRNNSIRIIDLLLSLKATRGGHDTEYLLSEEDYLRLKSYCSSFSEVLRCDLRVSKRPKEFLIKFVKNPVPALKALRATLLVLEDYDQNFSLKFNLVQVFSMYHTLINLSNGLEFIRVMKYFTSFPLALYLEKFEKKGYNQPDTSPVENPFLFVGKVRNYLRRRIQVHNNRNTRLWWSWLQGIKRACELPNEEFETAAYQKHSNLLKLEPPSLEDDFLISFQEKTLKLTQGFATTKRLFEFSPSACYETSKSNGGSLSFLLQYHNGIEDSFLPTTSYELLRMVEWKGKVREIYGLASPGMDQLKKYCQLNTHTSVKVQSIKEPLKVRMVTKGNAFAYNYAHFFQKDMHTHLKRRSQFEVIGSPLQHDHLYRMLERERKLDLGDDKPEFDRWVSGDYSAATDGINILLTKIVFEAFLSRSKLDGDDQEILRRVLYEQCLEYPEKQSLPCVQQRNGQLMGSPLSFPVLCAVNLIVYWIALERYLNHKVRYADLPVLVNGDDILFRTNNDLYVVWRSLLPQAGFTLSVGKNYVHPTLLTINSQLYRYRDDRLQLIPYFNVGLLTGQSKLGSHSGECLPLGQLYNMTMSGAFSKLTCHRSFYRYHPEMQQRSANWYLPEQYGGLGCDLYQELVDARCCTRLTYHHASRAFTMLKDLESNKKVQSGMVLKKRTNAVVIEHEHRILMLLREYDVRIEFCEEVEEEQVVVMNSQIPTEGIVTYKPYPARNIRKLARIPSFDRDLNLLFKGKKGCDLVRLIESLPELITCYVPPVA